MTISRPAMDLELLCREVVHAHGGTINVSSSEKETVFLVRLPRREEPAPGHGKS